MPRTIVGLVLLCLAAAAAADERKENVRYLRVLTDKTAPECVFTMERSDKGWSIISVTGRGPTKMTVTARYDADNGLTAADARLTKGDQTMTARVTVATGKAKVTRDAQEPQEFETPKGVIVTSAPDWADTFLLCQRYDRAKGGKQEFPGLWIHPEQPAQRIPFFIEGLGTDTIEHEGNKRELRRSAIRIRNNSAYAAWADGNGRMVKLISLPYKESSSTVLVLEGYEKSAAKLAPPQP